MEAKRAALEVERPARGPQEAQEAPKSAQEGQEAGLALLGELEAAEAARSRAERELAAAKANLVAAEHKLTPPREPVRPANPEKITREERIAAGLGTLPPRGPSLSEAKEGLVGHVDADGDPIVQSPDPIPALYGDPVALEAARQDAARIAAALREDITANKTRLWDRTLPDWTARLASAAREKGQGTVTTARAVLAQMRGSIDTAQAALGPDHALIGRMRDGLVGLIGRYAEPVRALIADEKARAMAALDGARSTWAVGHEKWDRVEKLRQDQAVERNRGPGSDGRSR